MSNREKQLIGLAVLLLVILLGYTFLYRPMMATRETLESEIDALNQQLTVLREEYAKMPEYEAGIISAENTIKEVTAKYPADLTQESAFKLIFDIEDAIEATEFTSVTFTPPEVLSYSSEDSSDGAVSLVQRVSTSQELTYEEVKDLLRYIYGYDDRTVLDGLTLSVSDNSGLINITLGMNMYAIVDGERPFTLPEFETVPTGREVLFSTKKAEQVAVERERREQVKDEFSDLFIALKPTASDIESQVIGFTLDNIQKSYIKLNVNGVLEGKLRVYQQDNQYYASYEIDGVRREAQRFDKGTALEMDVFAAKRLDDFDKVGLNLEVINETSSTFYINIKEEDYDSPRLKIEVTGGNVQIR